MSSVGGFWAAALAGCLTGVVLGALMTGLWVLIFVDYEAPDIAVVMLLVNGLGGGFVGFVAGAIAWGITTWLGRS